MHCQCSGTLTELVDAARVNGRRRAEDMSGVCIDRPHPVVGQGGTPATASAVADGRRGRQIPHDFQSI
jgi:hypothetical protein